MLTAACIDVTGSNRAMDVVWVGEDGHVTHRRVKGVEGTVDWAGEHLPRILAVDAPCEQNLARVSDASVRAQHGLDSGSYESFRVCEALLRKAGIGLYNTPRQNAPAWMRRGWDIYGRLQGELDYRLWRQPGRPQSQDGRTLIEVHPHASFVVGLGWIPHKKTTLAGQLERLAYLLAEAERLGIRLEDCGLSGEALAEAGSSLQRATWESIRAQGLHLPQLSHDLLDALAGLVTACLATRGRAFAVGEPEEGVIVVPEEPRGHYKKPAPQ